MSVNLRDFLMSLAATTVSIILTFGTTAIIDRKKQQAEKREMVRMILFDMRETLDNIRQMDTDMKDFFDVQVDVVAHPGKMDEYYLELASKIPISSYTTTTETIFRSSIETIQTIGSILFVQTVSSFYDTREQYKGQVVNDFQNKAGDVLGCYENLRDFKSTSFIFLSEAFLKKMTRDYEQCKMMMKVSEKELDEFSRQQKELLEATRGGVLDEIQQSTSTQQQRIERLQKAVVEGKKELNK